MEHVLLPRNQQKFCPGKLILKKKNTTFMFLKISINKMGARYHSVFASIFQKCNWIVKIVFCSGIDKGLFATDYCPGQKVKKLKKRLPNL